MYFIADDRSYLFHSNLTCNLQVFKDPINSSLNLVLTNKNLIIWTKKEMWHIPFETKQLVDRRGEHNFRINSKSDDFIKDIRHGSQDFISIIVEKDKH